MLVFQHKLLSLSSSFFLPLSLLFLCSSPHHHSPPHHRPPPPSSSLALPPFSTTIVPTHINPFKAVLSHATVGDILFFLTLREPRSDHHHHDADDDLLATPPTYHLLKSVRFSSNNKWRRGVEQIGERRRRWSWERERQRARRERERGVWRCEWGWQTGRERCVEGGRRIFFFKIFKDGYKGTVNTLSVLCLVFLCSVTIFVSQTLSMQYCWFKFKLHLYAMLSALCQLDVAYFHH